MPRGLSEFFQSGFVDITMQRIKEVAVSDGYFLDVVDEPYANQRVVHKSATFQKLAGKRFKVDVLFLEDLIKSTRWPGLENENKVAAL